MKGFHRPTLITVLAAVVVLFILYHCLWGRKNGGQK